MMYYLHFEYIEKLYSFSLEKWALNVPRMKFWLNLYEECPLEKYGCRRIVQGNDCDAKHAVMRGLAAHFSCFLRCRTAQPQITMLVDKQWITVRNLIVQLGLSSPE